MGSSLIYVAIVAMWAGLLVPMWLRRHEQETEVRSVDRFSTAMRILSRRTPPPPDRRYLVMPQRPPSATLPVADVPRTAPARRPAPRRPSANRPTTRRPTRRPAGRSRLVARRRRILLGLAGLALLFVVLALTGVVSWWWQLVSDLAVAAYVFHLRAEAKRTVALERRRQAARSRRDAVAPPPAAPRVEMVDVPATGRSAALTPPAAREEPQVAGPIVIDEETWEPVPVPLPTYVTAPVAEQPEQTIDLTRPGRWSDEQAREPLFDQEAEEEFMQDFADEVDDDELEVIVERRRAVND